MNEISQNMREVSIDINFLEDVANSCLIKVGKTMVICKATIEETVPPFLRKTGKGWVTSEYGMLPGSTNERMRREAKLASQSGRTQEIQRLIGRSLRAAVDGIALGERQIIIDCDVIQADGGTRCASICGGWVALKLATDSLLEKGIIKFDPIVRQVAAISCGILKGEAVLDLNYEEDSSAETDANFVMDNNGQIIEIQCSAEKEPFTKDIFEKMYYMATNGIEKLVTIQKEIFHE
ncbi:ribonuclease PH [Paracoccaceae bacterium]|nr:ribonuclease PH [Paracoccaceae bacterium]